MEEQRKKRKEKEELLLKQTFLHWGEIKHCVNRQQQCFSFQYQLLSLCYFITT